MSIHPTALVEDGANIAEDADVGPLCHIGAYVRIHGGVKIHSHVVVQGDTEIGAGTVIHPFAYIGGPPQHVRYKGERTKLIIGKNNIIREYTTMNPGTVEGGGFTHVGDGGFFMVGAHVAHDCKVGDHVIFANNATLGGHVEIGDGVFLGGLCAVHQNSRIGEYAFAAGGAIIANDVIPYALAIGNHARLGGLNIIGLKRRGAPRAVIHALRSAYRTLFNGEGAFRDRLERVRVEYGEVDDVMRIVEFIDRDASRPLMTPAR